MQKRTIQVDGVGIAVFADDQPDHAKGGGACHEYSAEKEDVGSLLRISFQHGPIGEEGVNGIQHWHLLKIVEDRLRSFQLGPFASTLNEVALSAVQAAIKADEERTARRPLAGVEGFNRPDPGQKKSL